MIKTFCILLFLCIICEANAQNNSAEAKAAYLLAEEEFNAGKYQSAIAYLNQATEKLGAANAKILYLKIMALQAIQKDDAHLKNLVQIIELFEKSADFETFNEEKKLEVYKLKLKLARLTSIEPTNALDLTAFRQMKITGWRLGMTLAALQEMEGDFFKTAQKVSMGETDQYYGAYRQSSGVAVIIKRGFLVQIHFYPPGQNASDSIKNASLLNEIKLKMGGDPKDTTITKVDFKKVVSIITKTRTVTWVDQNVRVVLSQTDIAVQSKTSGNSRTNMVVLSLMDDRRLK